MTTIVNEAIGLAVGDQVRTSYTDSVHTIERIWLYEPGEYEPTNNVSPGERTGIALDEPVVCVQCRERYEAGAGYGGESFLNGIVRRGDSWWAIAYQWPPFQAPAGLHLRELIRLRMETAPPAIVERDEIFMVARTAVPLQLDLFGGAQ